MQHQEGTAKLRFPLDGLAVVSATAELSPTPGLVRLVLDVEPREAYALSYRCDQPHQAGFAGTVGQLAFWAEWGVPINPNMPCEHGAWLANPRNLRVGIVPNRVDPGA